MSYDPETPFDSAKLIANEIVGAINRSKFLADQTFAKSVQSIPPSAIQFTFLESGRAFPVVSFNSNNDIPIMDSRIHAVTELLSCGALKNRQVFPQGENKGAAIIFQWTELGLRMMQSINAINPDRLKELRKQISEVPIDQWPPRELLDFPKKETAPIESRSDSMQAEH